MRKSITILFILAILVAVYMSFPGVKENVDIKHVSRDAGLSEATSTVHLTDPHSYKQNADMEHVSRDADMPESTVYLTDPQSYAAAVKNQKPQNEPVSPHQGQPLEPAIVEALNELVNTSHEGLVEEKTDNGVGVDLKGRFRTAPVATIDDKGQIIVQDYTSAPER